MISPAFITEWSQQCPWVSPAQVEQDLVLSRGLVEIYSDPILRDSLLFRGGTALHKIVLQPAARYSEDLDFVQLREEPIGDTLDRLRLRLNPWLGGTPERCQSSRGHPYLPVPIRSSPCDPASVEDRDQHPRTSVPPAASKN